MVERNPSVPGLVNPDVVAVAAGDAQFSSLTADEHVVAHSLVDARIAECAAQARFGRDARKAGQTTVSVDEDGTVVAISPDGSRRHL